MSVVVPSILVSNPDEYKELITRYHTFTNHVQVDIADGTMTPNATIGEAQIWWPQGWTVDIHLMAKIPSVHMDTLLNLKPSMVILHAEVDEDITSLLSILKKSGIKAGVALLRPTFPGNVKGLLEIADHAMIFSGNLGEYGGHASFMQTEKIHLIKNINPLIEIGWDGGIKVDNAFMIAQAGVDVLNVGGVLSKAEDPGSTYKSLITEITKHGVI